LADALMDAGCCNEIVLSHCRSAGPHVPGCWVVDSLLKKGPRRLPKQRSKTIRHPLSSRRHR
jgi:hypothetical protein